MRPIATDTGARDKSDRLRIASFASPLSPKAVLTLDAAMVMLCGAIALGVRHIVGSDSVEDSTSIWLTLATGTLLVLSFSALAAGAALARPARSRLGLWIAPICLLLVGAWFAWASVIDLSVAAEALMQGGDDKGTQASIAVGPNGTDVRFSGELTDGAAGRLAALLDANPRVKRIHLTSEGGLADEGQAVGDIIAAHALTTFVPDYCVSACTLAFVRGRERVVMDGARIGFHAPFQQGLFGRIYAGESDTERLRYAAAGVDTHFTDQALKVKPEDIWFPSTAQLIAAHVATRVVDRFALPDSTLDGNVTRDGARREILRNFPIAQAFESRDASALDATSDWYLSAYLGGRSEGEVSDGLKLILGTAVQVPLTRAKDQTLVDVARYMSQAMEAAATPETCVAIGARVDLIEAARELSRDDEAQNAAFIALAADALSAAGDLTASIRSSASGDGASHASTPTCNDLKLAYRALLARPRSEIAATIRAVIDRQARRSLVALSRLRQSIR